MLSLASLMHCSKQYLNLIGAFKANVSTQHQWSLSRVIMANASIPASFNFFRVITFYLHYTIKQLTSNHLLPKMENYPGSIDQ